MEEKLDQIQVKLLELEGKIDAVYKSSEKVRKYMMWTAIITIAVIVLPLLILPLVLPAFLQSVVLPGSF